MKPKWMRDEEARSDYGPSSGTLLKTILMGVGIAGAIDYLLNKNLLSFFIKTFNRFDFS